jgi:NAD-dependent dihydropyrimidine dehydrogenase PreA subunit
MDRSCVDQCPVDCIQAGERMLYINPVECIDCGACEPACPQEAIFADYAVPQPLARYGTVNAEFFTDARHFERGADHPAVAMLPTAGKS